MIGLSDHDAASGKLNLASDVSQYLFGALFQRQSEFGSPGFGARHAFSHGRGRPVRYDTALSTVRNVGTQLGWLTALTFPTRLKR